MAVFDEVLGVKTQVIPTRGGGEGTTLILGGHASFGIHYPGPALSLVRAKQVRALAQWGEKRIKNFPNVPTYREVGYPNLTFYSWYGWIVRKDTPAPILEKLRNL